MTIRIDHDFRMTVLLLVCFVFAAGFAWGMFSSFKETADALQHRMESLKATVSR